MALGDGAAEGRVLVGVVTRFQHAVAGHDDHEGISADRLRYRILAAAAADKVGDLVIGAGFAARNGAGGCIDALVEHRDPGHVERHIGEVGGAAAQLRTDALDRDLHHHWRTLFARLRIEPVKTPPGLDLPRFRQLHADDAGLAPRDAATADAGVKDCVVSPHQRTPTPSGIITLS